MGALWTDGAGDKNGNFQIYDGMRVNFYCLLLPYIEQANIYSPIDFSISGLSDHVWYLRNEEATEATFPALFCPSDGYGGTHAIHPQIPDQKWARSNYLGMFTGFQIGDLLQYDPLMRAFFDGNLSTRFKDITDGSSHTIAMTEGLRERTGPGGRGMAWSDQPGGSQVFSELAPNSPLPDRFYPAAGWWCINDDLIDRPCIFGDANTTDTAAARSNHPGGVNAVFADGSTRFISESIDLDSWRAAATIMAGEVVAP